MKALRLQVSEEKNFEVCLLCSNVRNCESPGAGPVFTTEALYVQNWLRSMKRCSIPNIKALCLPASEKINFEDGLLCSYVTTNVAPPPGAEPVLIRGGHHMNKRGRVPQGDAVYQI